MVADLFVTLCLALSVPLAINNQCCSLVHYQSNCVLFIDVL